MFEDNWQRTDGQLATREHLVMALADLDTVLIKMNYMDDCSSSSIISISLDYAEAHRTGGEIAYEVCAEIILLFLLFYPCIYFIVYLMIWRILLFQTNSRIIYQYFKKLIKKLKYSNLTYQIIYFIVKH